mmetsp:Transcript_7904/g.15880  ORF Transcript_7904/g.15880 Transcript_7904/m.15880 type:complete len:273 (-) Transcript_7904:83-901(-)
MRASPSAPMFPLGVNPNPPISPALKSEIISPYKFGITITSNWVGRETSCMHVLSTIISSYSIAGYFSATSWQHLIKRPSDCFIIFALCTAVTFLRPLATAYLNANSATLSLAFLVITLRDSTTPGTTSCSNPEYSPSVFSRIVTRLTSSYRVLYPGMDKQGRTFAYSCNSFLRVRFNDLNPFPIGVVIGPFSPILFRSTESKFSRVMKLFVRGSTSLPICCSSHSIGASAALKISFTDSAISGPIPSPGNRVAVIGLTPLLYPLLLEAHKRS